MQPLVISYVRFSSRKQQLGDSLQRQLDACQTWCASTGRTLSEDFSYSDLGVSGFTGANRTIGALSVLLTAISDGRIPSGSYLLIENFDRLTRELLLDAVRLMTDIIQAGLIVVTLGGDPQEWDAARLTDPASFIMLVLLLSRGHTESARKSELISKSIARARADKRVSIFGHRPGWLRIENGEFVVIAERAESIKRVFELSAAGVGSYAIAKRANAENWPVPTGDAQWGEWLPNKLLSNRALLGLMEFRTEKTGKRVILDTCPDWYPRIISDEVYYAARAAITARKSVPPRTDDHCRNLLKGLGVCGQCGASLLRRNHTGTGRKPGYGRYACSRQFKGISDCQTFNALDFELGLIPKLYEIYSEQFSTATRAADAIAEIEQTTALLLDLNSRRANIVIAIETGGKIPILVLRLAALADEIRSATESLSLSRAKHAAATVPDTSADVSAIVRAIRAPSDDIPARELRAAAHLKLLRFVECIWLRPGAALIKLRDAPDVVAIPIATTGGMHAAFLAMFGNAKLPEPQLSNRGFGYVRPRL